MGKNDHHHQGINVWQKWFIIKVCVYIIFLIVFLPFTVFTISIQYFWSVGRSIRSFIHSIYVCSDHFIFSFTFQTRLRHTAVIILFFIGLLCFVFYFVFAYPKQKKLFICRFEFWTLTLPNHQIHNTKIVHKIMRIWSTITNS